MANKEQVLQALSQIIDPDFKKNIVSLDFIKDLKIEGTEVSFSIELTTPACPMKNKFLKQAKELVGALEGVNKVNVNMTAREAGRKQPVGVLEGVKNVVAIASAKGGVGKSTMAAAIACEVASRGFKVGLLDADLFGPSIPTLFNIHNPPINQVKDKLQPIIHNNIKLMSFGFLLGDSPAVMRGPMVSNYIQQLLLNVEWGELDYLFIDMPPGTGDIQLTISQSVQLDGAVIVTTRSNLSIVDVARGILMFEKVQVPMLGIIENMAYFVCDSCDKKHFIFGEPKKGLSERFGLDTLVEMPLLPGSMNNYETYESSEHIITMTDMLIRKLGMAQSGKVEPPKVEMLDNKVKFVWQDGSESVVGLKKLRYSCQCASCIDEFTGEQILKESSINDDISVKEIFPLGNYAVSVQWSDGHSSSIYPYEQLKTLSE